MVRTCCDKMEWHLESTDRGENTIHVTGMDEPAVWTKSKVENSNTLINYCPWCGYQHESHWM